ncbi:MAG: hypothetical protein Q8P27_03030 [Candidatus Peregrinibacteria bacterium]|nr:hypothetical protein [Candidatus Peregrinibacteria bacterium]
MKLSTIATEPVRLVRTSLQWAARNPGKALGIKIAQVALTTAIGVQTGFIDLDKVQSKAHKAIAALIDTLPHEEPPEPIVAIQREAIRPEDIDTLETWFPGEKTEKPIDPSIEEERMQFIAWLSEIET